MMAIKVILEYAPTSNNKKANRKFKALNRVKNILFNNFIRHLLGRITSLINLAFSHFGLDFFIG